MADAEPLAVTEDTLRAKLVEKLQATHVEIEDISGGCGQAFSALIVSAQFIKKTTLARHRLVNTALKAEISAIHAWTPKCYAPEEWERLIAAGGQRNGDGQTQSKPVAPGKATTEEIVAGTTA